MNDIYILILHYVVVYLLLCVVRFLGSVRQYAEQPATWNVPQCNNQKPRYRITAVSSFII
jgi:hypothetical protein